MAWEQEPEPLNRRSDLFYQVMISWGPEQYGESYRQERLVMGTVLAFSVEK